MRKQHGLKIITATLTVAMFISIFGGMQMNAAAAEEVSVAEESAATVSSAVVRLNRQVGVAINQKREGEVAAEIAAQQAAEAARIEAERQAAEQKAAEQKAAEEAAKKAAAQKTSSKTQSSKKTSGSTATYNKNQTIGQNIVNAARRAIGIAYGASAYGTTFDCSGLTQWAYAQVGIQLSHSAAAQKGQAVSISRSALQPGDLVFWASGGNVNHVGIYSGGGMVIDASPKGVVERPLYDSPSQYICGYGRAY